MATIRLAAPADVPDVARVHVASWRSTYRGIVPDDVLDNLNVDRRAEGWQAALDSAPAQGRVILVAETEADGVIGFASAGPERESDPRYRSELYAIYLLDTAQGRGIGGRLVRAAASWLLEQGHEAMLVWVLRDNPARGFYERLGGVYLREKPITVGSAILSELCFGWADLRELAPD